MISYVVPVFADTLATVSLRLGKKEAAQGEEINVTVVVSGCPEIKSMALKPEYDSDGLELVSCEWSEEIRDNAIIADFDSEKGNAAVAFLSPADINGDVLVITFRVKDDASLAEFDISVYAVIKNGDIDIPNKPIENSIPVVCRHDISEGKLGIDEDGHWYKCSECYAKVNYEAHSKKNSVKENENAPTCTQKGSYDEVFYCEICDFEMMRTNVEVSEKGHNLTEVKAKKTTCTEDGNTAYYYCDICKSAFSDKDGKNALKNDSWIIKSGGHTKVNGVCTVCGEGELTFKYGDVDMDNSISSADARLVLRNSVGLEAFDEMQEILADVDFDNSISSADARLVLRNSVGLEKDFTRP